MRYGFVKGGLSRSLLASMAALTLAAAPALAQQVVHDGHGRTYCPPPPCPPGMIVPAPVGAAPAPPPTAPPEAAAPVPLPESFQPTVTEAEPTAPEGRAFAAGGETLALNQGAAGYIDTAVIMPQLRLRFDAAYRNNRPDRAEFFYAKCGCFRTVDGPFRDPNAPGPPLPETEVDYQDITAYIERPFSERFSAFVEIPVRFLNPEQNANTAGLSDIMAGLRLAVVADEYRWLTLQVRAFAPTGDADRGLGTHHASIEPAILLYQRMSDRVTFQGEVRDWIPIGGTDFAGNVIRYGAGLGVDVVQGPRVVVTPIAEFVGWTVLDGKVFGFPADQFIGPQDASGDTIVNAKLGVRTSFGEHRSLYFGYGRALTGDVWYKDIIRLEYRLVF